MTMAYILAVNSNMLADAGMDAGAVFVATALSATVACFVMAFLSNLAQQHYNTFKQRFENLCSES